MGNLSIERVKELSEAFSSYSVLVSSGTTLASTIQDDSQPEQVSSDRPAMAPVPLQVSAGTSDSGKSIFPPGAKEAMRVAFSPSGGALQDLMVTETARLTTA